MSTWLEEIGYRGYWESEVISIPLVGDGVISSINWVETIPNNTYLIMQCSCSFDDGNKWSDFEQIYQSQSIPQINSESDLNNFKIKFRAIFNTDSNNLSPELSNISMSFIPVIYYNNIGDLNIQPEIEIKKIGNGDISLINISNNNELFKFTGLIDGEIVHVDNENQQIINNLTGVSQYRYNNFNDNYLDIPIGINIFKISGNAQIQFRSQFKILA